MKLTSLIVACYRRHGITRTKAVRLLAQVNHALNPQQINHLLEVR